MIKGVHRCFLVVLLSFHCYRCAAVEQLFSHGPGLAVRGNLPPLPRGSHSSHASYGVLKTIGSKSFVIRRYRECVEQGIFLSPLEEQSSRMFEFVFKMFSVGSASLPEGGIGEVPLQIAADLPEGIFQ